MVIPARLKAKAARQVANGIEKAFGLRRHGNFEEAGWLMKLAFRQFEERVRSTWDRGLRAKCILWQTSEPIKTLRDRLSNTVSTLCDGAAVE